jgi:Type IV secretion system pilin
MIILFGCMKSKLLFTLTLVLLFIPAGVFAAEFRALVGIPGIENIAADGGLNQYINALYRLSISIAALLAVIKIVIAGAKYMLTDIVPAKEEAKKDIQGALIGLLIVIGAIIILNTINTDLANVNFNLEGVELDDEINLSANDELARVCADRCYTNLCSSLGNMAVNSGLPPTASCREHCNAYEDSYFYRPSNTMEPTCAVNVEAYEDAVNALNTDLINEYCPEGKECSVSPCNESEVEGSFTCEVFCTQTGTNIGYYDTDSKKCVRENITREQSCIDDGDNWNIVNRSCAPTQTVRDTVCQPGYDCRIAQCNNDSLLFGCSSWCNADERINDIGFGGGQYNEQYNVCYTNRR